LSPVPEGRENKEKRCYGGPGGIRTHKISEEVIDPRRGLVLIDSA
jgi:hypothetical protein